MSSEYYPLPAFVHPRLPSYIKERERLMNQMVDAMGINPNTFTFIWPAIQEQPLPNCSADECGGLKYYERPSRVPLWSR